MSAASAPPPSSTAEVVERALPVVHAALDELGPRLLRVTGQVASSAKRDGTPVTHADRAADVHLVDALQDAFPTHGMVSEEQRTTAPSTVWTWVIDPIDGTSNFIAGLPYWCVSVALLHEGDPVLAVVDAPVLDRRYQAVAGQGATCGDQQLQVREPVDWRHPGNRHVPVMLTTATARRVRRAGVRLNPRVMGSTALDMCVVAEGVAAASVAVIPKVWDIAAGALLVREAGGVVETLTGDPLLPLRAGQEQAGRSAATATGPTSAYVRDLARRLLAD